jgi:hypothetical protein
MEDVRIFYGHLVYFMAIGSILWPLGLFYGLSPGCQMVYF